MDDKQRIALVETRTQGTDPAPAQLIRYQFGNHLGSASLELDRSGAGHLLRRVCTLRQHVVSGVRSQTETPKRYRYTGKERDEESGLYYHGARYYAPWLGRWVSCDPSGMIDGTNLYRYVSDNPIQFADPSGRQQVVNDLDPKNPNNFINFESYRAANSSQPEDVVRQVWNEAHLPAQPSVAQASQWGQGPRGERIPTAAWRGGPLRPIEAYTKPYARIHAEQGNYEAAELAENYLCATCHVLTKVNSRDFNLRGYVTAYQESYIKGFVEVPLTANPIGAAWEIGVSGGQAITGESSGLHISNISDVLVHGKSDIGRRLSTRERLWEGGTFVVGAATLGLSLRAPVSSVRQPPGLTPQQAANWERAVVEAERRVAAAKLKYGGEGIVNMAISRQQALNRIQGLSAPVEEHLAKIAAEPSSQAVAHWRKEIRAWLGEIERLTPHIGKKTGDVWTNRVAEWRRLLGE